MSQIASSNAVTGNTTEDGEIVFQVNGEPVEGLSIPQELAEDFARVLLALGEDE